MKAKSTVIIPAATASIYMNATARKGRADKTPGLWFFCDMNATKRLCCGTTINNGGNNL